MVTEVSAILFKYLLFPQVNVLGFQLLFFSTYDNFYMTCFIFNFLFELHVLLLNLHLKSHEICFAIVLAPFLFVIILNVKAFNPLSASVALI